MNPKEIIDMLKSIKTEIENDGLIPTMEEGIERVENFFAEISDMDNHDDVEQEPQII